MSTDGSRSNSEVTASKFVDYAFLNSMITVSRGGLPDNRLITFLRKEGHSAWLDDIRDEQGYPTGKRGIFTTVDSSIILKLKYRSEKELSDDVLANVKHTITK